MFAVNMVDGSLLKFGRRKYRCSTAAVAASSIRGGAALLRAREGTKLRTQPPMGRTGRNGVPGQPTSRARDGSRDGFTLLELICVIAILALLSAAVLPVLPRGTSRARLESFALAAASLLKSDRNAALLQQKPVATIVDAPARFLRSSASRREVRVPNDVTFDAVLASRCSERQAGSAIIFLPSGMSCGGVITLSRLGMSYQIRVNWLTGGVDIVAGSRA